MGRWAAVHSWKCLRWFYMFFCSSVFPISLALCAFSTNISECSRINLSFSIHQSRFLKTFINDWEEFSILWAFEDDFLLKHFLCNLTQCCCSFSPVNVYFKWRYNLISYFQSFQLFNMKCFPFHSYVLFTENIMEVIYTC